MTDDKKLDDHHPEATAIVTETLKWMSMEIPDEATRGMTERILRQRLQLVGVKPENVRVDLVLGKPEYLTRFYLAALITTSPERVYGIALIHEGDTFTFDGVGS